MAIIKNFTQEKRQAIVRAFAIKHNGRYNPKLFLKEVQDTGEKHPAYTWFEWDAAKAAYEYQLEQAREFARDLKVTFTVETVGRSKAIKVVQTSMPMVLSPVENRKDGGGYVLVDPKLPDHMVEHCRQAAVALRSWVNRYEAAMLHASIRVDIVEDIATRLETVPSNAVEAA